MIVASYWISIICSECKVSRTYHEKSFWKIWYNLLPRNHVIIRGFFAVKRRAVFIIGAMCNALVRGWRSDCVVGGMGTRFQWRKAHSRTAKCEAFHVAPRLFFMFLFLIPFTIRQLCVIYPQEFSTEPWISLGFALLWFFCTDLRIFFDNCYWKIFFISKFAPQKW